MIKLQCLILLIIYFKIAVSEDPSKEFSKYSITWPKVYHGTEKREIESTQIKNGIFTKHLKIELSDKNWVLDLTQNNDLIPSNFFIRSQESGKDITRTPTEEEKGNCHYHGKIEGITDSQVAVSICDGISGIIYDGSRDDIYYIEPDQDKNNNKHYIYHGENPTLGANNKVNRLKREIRGPYNANKQSRYVEFVFVVDKSLYQSLGNETNVINNCKKIINVVNFLYRPLNIFIALTGVVIWKDTDQIVLADSGDTTLSNFLNYRRTNLLSTHANDYAHLLTSKQFERGVIGKALKGPICTYEYSGGVGVVSSKVIGLIANNVAHQMGHIFGMEHDSGKCICPGEYCIMSPFVSNSSIKAIHWSSCSIEYLNNAFKRGMDYCLKNKPKRIIAGPECGNGFVEEGEQCDCGLPEYCTNQCCNANTCRLFENAKCATGECCDLNTCELKQTRTICREKDGECDLEEYCNGESEYCPDNLYRMNGQDCKDGNAYCYEGKCRSHTDQCRLLWGSSGSSESLCYELNIKGNRNGNCGFNRYNQSYVKCATEDVACGMLQCRHSSERLEFGMESVSILSHTFLPYRGEVIPCRAAIIDLGLDEVDPGLVPDGAKCGESKMCVKQKCVSVNTTCPNDCNDHGVCNNKGECHCNIGYDPPNCLNKIQYESLSSAINY